MKARFRFPTEREGGDYRRVLYVALAASALLHLMLFALVGRGETTIRVTSAAGPPSRDPIPSSGGAMQAVNVAPVQKIQVPPPPRYSPTAPEVQLRSPEERVRLASVPLEAPTGGGEPGPTAGRGTDGRGDAGAGDAGPCAGTRPVPRVLVPEWDAPHEVRGTSVTIRVRIDSQGHPVGPVELDPPTSNDAFNRKLMDAARKMEFQPPRSSCQASHSWGELKEYF